MEKKINYQQILLSKLQEIKEKCEKPTLCLHACCGPCFTIPYEIIKGFFKITVIYNNSNIYPKEEHDRRLEEFKRYFDWEKSGQKFIVTDIYDTPLTKEDKRKLGNNSIYVQCIEVILLQYLSKQEGVYQ